MGLLNPITATFASIWRKSAEDLALSGALRCRRRMFIVYPDVNMPAAVRDG